MINFCKDVEENLNILSGENYAKYFVQKKIEFFDKFSNGLVTSCFHGIDFFKHVIEYHDKPEQILKDFKLKKELYNLNFVQILRDNSKMVVEVWESELEDSTTVVLKGDKSVLKKDAIKIRTIEGKDWNDCMRQHYELMGWEPYKPF